MSTTSPPTDTATAPTARAGMPAPVIFVVDVICVVIFAMAGRSAHGGMQGIANVANVAWPFLVALVVGWMIVGGTRRTAPRSIADGAIVFVATLAGGMLVRGATGGGTATAFIMVAASFLALTLIGWRLLARRPLRGA
ncbi:MAG: DUF3054 domain-containing protein [Dermatophilus congolensis]|nr:DUF3054 domain-containing protein [Dermatophilus congolensis]